MLKKLSFQFLASALCLTLIIPSTYASNPIVSHCNGFANFIHQTDFVSGQFEITNSGVYCLAEDVAGQIYINADKVELDLNTFNLDATGITSAIYVDTRDPNEDIQIANGSIQEGSIGIDLNNGRDPIENLFIHHIKFNGQIEGIFVTGVNIKIENNTIPSPIYVEGHSSECNIQISNNTMLLDTAPSPFHGIALGQACDNSVYEIKDNEINVTGAFSGILISASRNSSTTSINNNLITTEETGIIISTNLTSESPSNLFHIIGNQIIGETVNATDGIHVTGMGADATIEHNYFSTFYNAFFVENVANLNYGYNEICRITNGAIVTILNTVSTVTGPWITSPECTKMLQKNQA